MAVNKRSIMTRFFLIVVLFATVGVCIVIKGAIIMFKERGYWNEVADRFVKENVMVDPNRGIIGKFAARIFIIHGFHGKRPR